MPSWLDLRVNKEKYPDAMTIDVNGEKMTLGEYRNEMGPVSEFVKQTQKLSQEREQAVQAYQQTQAQLQQAQAYLQQMQQARNQAASQVTDDPMNPYRQDPAFSPLVSYYDKQMQDMKSVIQQQAQHLQQATVAVNSWRYSTQLEKLKEQDPEFDTQKLAAFTTDLYTKGPDVQAAYRLMSYEDRLKRAESEAERRGYEKAKAEPPAPPMPGGRRGDARGTTPLALPKDLNARVDLALQDGPMMNDLAQGLAELTQG